MIDTFMMLEDASDSRFRMLRSLKNRFGAVNELGVFAMTERGLREVANPSAIFLSRAGTPAPGSLVVVVWEGSRPLLVEVQALVDDGQSSHARRLAVGIEANRLALLLAVLHRHAGLALGDQDVFLNVVGGVRVARKRQAILLRCWPRSRASGARPCPVPLLSLGRSASPERCAPYPRGWSACGRRRSTDLLGPSCPRATRPDRPRRA